MSFVPRQRDVMRLVIGFSPGSASDFVARLLLPELAQRVGEAIVMERIPGENGALAARKVAAAEPDGRTILLATLGTHALAPHFAPAPGYDPMRDFEPVFLVARAPLVLGCHPALGITSVPALMNAARAGQLTFGSSAVGGAPHLAGELFNAMAHVSMRHAPYARTEELYHDLERGRIGLSFNNIMSMAPRIRCGRLTGIAVTTRERTQLLPELPALAECGLPEYEVTNWLGIVAPPGTPPDVLDSLNTEIGAALAADGVGDALRRSGMERCGGSRADFSVHLARELARWKPVVSRFTSRRSGQRVQREEAE